MFKIVKENTNTKFPLTCTTDLAAHVIDFSIYNTECMIVSD